MTLEEPRNIPSLDAPDLETTITRDRFLSKALDKNTFNDNFRPSKGHCVSSIL